MKQAENPEDGADYSRWGNQTKSPQRNMADAHHGSSIKGVERTLVHHPNSNLFEPLSICNKFKEICSNISKPLSLNNRFKILEMLNNYNNEYICDDSVDHSECSVIQTNRSFQNELANSYNTDHETLNLKDL